MVGETAEGGWARHVFYDTRQGGLMAFWDIHDGEDQKLDGFDASISRGLGSAVDTCKAVVGESVRSPDGGYSLSHAPSDASDDFDSSGSARIS